MSESDSTTAQPGFSCGPTPLPASFEAFAAEHTARGFNEVLVRNWPANTVLDTHTHPFGVSAVVVDGEMWLTVGSDTRHLAAGDGFTLAADLPHAERYGPAGAVFWAARRHPAQQR